MPVVTIGSKRLLFIHVPKTGGTSVEALLRSYGGTMASHARPRAAGLPCTPQHFHGDLLAQIFGHVNDRGQSEHDFDLVFMTVRDPLARLLSEYRHQRTLRPNRTAKRGPPRPVGVLPGAAQVLDFTAWSAYALRRTARNPYFADNHFRPQHEFAIWNPVLFRIEDGLDAVKTYLDEFLGIEGELPESPQMASTDRAGTISELGATTQRRVRGFYARDYSMFGY